MRSTEKMKFCRAIIITYFVGFCSPVEWLDVTNIVLQKRSSLATQHGRREIKNLVPRDLFEMKPLEELHLVDEAETAEGTVIKRYKETYQGIPVYDAYASIETDYLTNDITGQATGYIFRGIAEDISDEGSRISENGALQIAINKATRQLTDFSIDQEEINFIIYVKNKTAILTYNISFRLKLVNHFDIPGYFVNAKTGEILREFTTVKSYNLKSVGGNAKSNKHIYGFDMPYLDVHKDGELCSLRTEYVSVYHLHNKWQWEAPKIPFTFNCSEGIIDSANGGYSPLSDVYYYSNRIISMFTDWINILPTRNSPIKFYVHNGKDDTAHFYPKDLVIALGDGVPLNTYPYTAVDVVGHEIGHAFTDEHSQLEYSGQSGGVCESMSDIIGEAAEVYVWGDSDNLAGGNIYVRDFGRQLCNQVEDGMSVVHVDNYTDGMGVHFSSGIFNKVACVLTKTSLSNITWKDVFKIFTYANRFYWHAMSNFNDAGCGILKAAYDQGYNLEHVRFALQEAGIVPCDIDNHLRLITSPMILVDLEASSKGQEIVFKIDFNALEKDYGEMLSVIQIITNGGKGDVDIFVFRYPHKTGDNYVFNSSRQGNSELIYVERDVLTIGYLFLRPKQDMFSGVEFKVYIIK